MMREMFTRSDLDAMAERLVVQAADRQERLGCIGTLGVVDWSIVNTHDSIDLIVGIICDEVDERTHMIDEIVELWSLPI